MRNKKKNAGFRNTSASRSPAEEPEEFTLSTWGWLRNLISPLLKISLGSSHRIDEWMWGSKETRGVYFLIIKKTNWVETHITKFTIFAIFKRAGHWHKAHSRCATPLPPSSPRILFFLQNQNSVPVDLGPEQLEGWWRPPFSCVYHCHSAFDDRPFGLTTLSVQCLFLPHVITVVSWHQTWWLTGDSHLQTAHGDFIFRIFPMPTPGCHCF